MKRSLAILLTAVFLLYSGTRKIRIGEEMRETPVVFCAERVSTMIVLPAEVKRVYVGAITSWAIVARDNKVVVRPVDSVPTNLLVEMSDGKVVAFRLKVVKEKAKADDVIVVQSSASPMVYEVAERKPEKKEEPQSVPNLTLLSGFNFNYRFRSSPRISIKNVLDDGKFTYIVFNPGSKIGVVYLCRSGFLKLKRCEVINFTYSKGVMKIDRLLDKGERFEIVFDKEKAVVRRLG